MKDNCNFIIKEENQNQGRIYHHEREEENGLFFIEGTDLPQQAYCALCIDSDYGIRT
jgi:hypothetical protein